MPYHYSDPKRAAETYACPNVETFKADKGDWWHDKHGERCDKPEYVCPQCEGDMEWSDEAEDFVCSDCNRNAEAKETPCGAGWYYWYCLPGCLPDSEPNGPFKTEEDALADMRENAGNDDEPEHCSECGEARDTHLTPGVDSGADHEFTTED